MSTSGSVDYNLTRDQIIRAAFELLGILTPYNDFSSEDLGTGSRVLNLMIKGWQSAGVYIWKESEAILFLNPSQRKYTLGPSGDRASNTVVNTFLDGDLVATDTAITVSGSTEDITAGDNVGVELDDGTLFWTTVDTIDSDTQLTFVDGVSDTCSDGAVIYSYTSGIQKPLNLTSIHLRSISSSTYLDRLVYLEGRDDYMDRPNKFDTGTVLSAYYQPQISTGFLYVFQVPSSVREVLLVNYYSAFEDFDSSTDNADFPTEWLETIIWNLACRLAPHYGKDAKAQGLSVTALGFYDNLRQWSKEHTRLTMGPDLSSYR